MAPGRGAEAPHPRASFSGLQDEGNLVGSLDNYTELLPNSHCHPLERPVSSCAFQLSFKKVVKCINAFHTTGLKNITSFVTKKGHCYYTCPKAPVQPL